MNPARALRFLVLVTAAGCELATREPAKAGSDQAVAAAPTSGEVLRGPVLEQLAAAPYLYLRIKTSKGEVWAAVPEGTVDDGAEVTVHNPVLMANFESASLKRTFEEIYFGTLTPPSAQSDPAADPHAGVRSAAPADIGPVAKATGPDARTIAEVWAQRANLAGKTVTIRGVVVKYNAGVMGKNWIHLQDGSGDPGQGTNDITVTSLDGASRGETVTIRGTVAINRDFGAGYSYPIIIEDAKVIKDL
ncbi:MAG: nucleotide-binding protein [Gemmatimonadales bacterium]